MKPKSSIFNAVGARLLRVVVTAVLLSGCATWPARPITTAVAQKGATIAGFGDIRRWQDAPFDEWAHWRERWTADRAAAGNDGRIRILALSSGSDKGAFAAGYLTGWTRRGDRPDFALVTGVSTGALIAPFAFIGRDGDTPLAALFTGIGGRDIFRPTPVSGVLGGPSLADTRPLQRLIGRYMTNDIADRIAREHGKGRRLLVLTTNLDAGRGVVWDLGAIAASSNPDRITLIRKILLASASVPGAFAPVLIDAISPEGAIAELHVDGGTTSSLFVIPAAVLSAPTGSRPDLADPVSITLLYNGVLEPEYEVVKPRTFVILSRALATVIGEADRQAIASYRLFAKENGVSLCVASMGTEFKSPHPALFDRSYMRALFDYGAGRATAGSC